MYQLLEPYMEQAISNAKKLANINKGKKASQSTPGTEVYRLIEKLLPYLKYYIGCYYTPWHWTAKGIILLIHKDFSYDFTFL